MMEIPSVLSGLFPFWIGGGFISIQRIKDSSLAHKRYISFVLHFSLIS